MKKIFKALSGITAALVLFIYIAVIYGTCSIPDEISRGDEKANAAGFIFSAADGTDAAGGDISISVLGVIPVKNVKISAKRRYVGIGGDAFGIKMYTEGIVVVGTDSVSTGTGSRNPAAEAGLKSGDIISEINGIKPVNAESMTHAIGESGGRELHLTVIRGKERLSLSLRPEKSLSGKYKAGLWVRDSSAGIGTVTFYDDERGSFAGLGHGVCDVDTGKIMPLANGEAVKATISGYYRSSPGEPGELCGIFSEQSLGTLRANLESGVFGTISSPSGSKSVPVALESEVREGAARMVTTIDGTEPQYYDIEIIKVYPVSDLSTRNMIIKVTDPGLLQKTGGIVQGMSGSPIIQDSKLVGAVTHVFVNDPSKGYGIFASRMIDSLDAIMKEELDPAS